MIKEAMGLINKIDKGIDVGCAVVLGITDMDCLRVRIISFNPRVTYDFIIAEEEAICSVDEDALIDSHIKRANYAIKERLKSN